MARISVIVPVYNAESYLSRCVDSLLAQTYTDFELLLINDGSKDSSGLICDSYAQLDFRVHVYHKPNGGVSSARNLGLDKAKGEWISFVDSDDWVDSDFLEKLSNGINTDLSILSYQVDGFSSYDSDFPSGQFGRHQIGSLLDNYGAEIQFTVPWSKLFKYEIIKLHNLRFRTDISTVEDTIFVYNYLRYVTSIYSDQTGKYHYIQQENGLSKNLFNNHMQYGVIIEELHSVLLHLCELYSFSEVKLFRELIEGRIFQEYEYVYHSHSFSEGYTSLKQLLANRYVMKYCREIERPTFGLKARTLLFLSKYNCSFLLFVYLRFLRIFTRNFL